MTSAFLCFLCYTLCFISDTLELRSGKKTVLSRILFLLGCMGLAALFLLTFFEWEAFSVSLPNLFPSFVFVLSVIMLLYSVFPAVSSETSDGKKVLVSSGLYSLCRHPGLWFMWACCLSFYFMCPTLTCGLLSIVSALCDFLYVLYQDMYVFPVTIDGYEKYKETVPFLFPRFK